MIPEKLRFGFGIWAPGAKKPKYELYIEVDQPGAAALKDAIVGIGPTATASQIKQAIAQGLNQIDVAFVIDPNSLPKDSIGARVGEAIKKVTKKSK